MSTSPTPPVEAAISPAPGDTEIVKHFKRLGVCGASIISAGTRKDAADAWNNSQRADWIMWWAAKTGVNAPVDVIKCATGIARSVAHLVSDPRCEAGVSAAEAWLSNPCQATVLSARTAAAQARKAHNEISASGNAVASMAARAAAWAPYMIVTEFLPEAARAVVWSARHADPATDHLGIVRAAMKQPWTEGAPDQVKTL